MLSAAALRRLHGEMVARLVIDSPALEARVQAMGIRDPRRICTARDLAPGKRIVFAACGVTEGALLNGVRFFGGGARTHSCACTGVPSPGLKRRPAAEAGNHHPEGA